ncbi:MAG: hypothetical protein QOE93_2249, partial [Actinomycetota bacterium]|nr:hypothetical protein [Actinomycetota bacterium]
MDDQTPVVWEAEGDWQDIRYQVADAGPGPGRPSSGRIAKITINRP